MKTFNDTNEEPSILFADIGNSRIKAAIKDKEQWSTVFSDDHSRLHQFLSFIKSSKSVGKVMVSSVVDRITEELMGIPGVNVQPVLRSDIAEDRLDYKTPESLGIDRYLACLGAWRLSASTNVIVVDAGTACTIDFMDAGGVYHGGTIAPGLSLLERALHEYAPALPSASRKIPDTWPGKSTSECIQWGITGGFLDGVKAALNRYRTHYGSQELWLTGGDSLIIKELLDRPAQLNEYLVFEGMDELLNSV